MSRPRRWLPLPMLGLLLLPAAVAAHPLAPSLLEVREMQRGQVHARWRTPVQRPPGSDLVPLLPSRCTVVETAPSRLLDTTLEMEWTLDCGAQSLVAARIGASDISASRADVLLRVVLADGRRFQAVLTPDAPSFVVPARQGRLSITSAYGALGVAHILSGWDHLLFVLGLILLVTDRWLLVKTITAFTLGHSLTLALAVLDVVHVPPALAEAAIALTLFVLAGEIARGSARPPTFLARHPWPMAAGFGLLHGLGFASALAAAGLPQGEIPLALASFNVGIEVGQLACAVVGIILRGALLRLAWPSPARALLVPTYVIGALAAFWLIERTGPLLRAVVRWSSV